MRNFYLHENICFLFLGIILKMEKDLKTIKNELKEARQNEVLCAKSIENESNKLNNLRSLYNETKIKVNEQTKNINECRHKIGVIAKPLINTEKELTVITTNIKKKEAKYHAILKNCKVILAMIHMVLIISINFHFWSIILSYKNVW